jgi:hypothetical protein
MIRSPKKKVPDVMAEPVIDNSGSRSGLFDNEHLKHHEGLEGNYFGMLSKLSGEHWTNYHES